MQITVTPHRIFWLLVAGSLGLTAMSVADHFVAQFWVTAPDLLIKALDRFELDREASFPTWYSAALLGVCSALPSVIAHVLHQRRSPDAKYWTGLAFMFLFCSVDEVATVHESLRLP